MATEPTEADIMMLGLISCIDNRDELRARLKAVNNDANAAAEDFFNGSPKYLASKTTNKWDESAWNLDREGTNNQVPAFRIESAGDDIAHNSASVAPSRPPSRTHTPVGGNMNADSVAAWQQNQTSFWGSGQATHVPEATGHSYPVSMDEEEANLQAALAMSRGDNTTTAQETGVTPATVDTGGWGGAGAGGDTTVVDTGGWGGRGTTPDPPVVDVTEVHFGPANRSAAEYDKAQWSLVPASFNHADYQTIGPSLAAGGAGASSTTAAYDEPPSTRTRKPNAPAFLLSMADKQIPTLAAVLTVLNEVPAARNALLQTGTPTANYHHNATWWRGTPAEIPARAAGGDMEDDGHVPGEAAMFEELHRIMAFLDSSNRSYASVDRLLSQARTQDGAGSQFESGDVLSTFIDKVSGSVVPSHEKVFNSHLCRQLRAPQSESSVFGMGPVSILDFDGCELAALDGTIMDLYDVLNELMWSQMIHPGNEEDSDNTASFVVPGDVIMMRWTGAPLLHELEIPETIYLDRYLESNKEVSVAMQQGMCAIAQKRSLLMEVNAELFEKAPTSGETVPRTEYYQRMADQCNAKVVGIREDAEWRAADARWKASREREKKGIKATKEDMDPTRFAPALTENEEKTVLYWQREATAFQKAIEVTKLNIKTYEAANHLYDGILGVITQRCSGYSKFELDAMMLQVRKKFASDIGEENATRAWNKLDRECPGMLNPHSWNDPKASCKRYLRGVAVGDKTVYVCRRKIRDGASLDTPMVIDGEADDTHDWWKIEYREDEPEPVKVEVVEMVQARIAAGRTKDRPFLIYASAEALEQDNLPLSHPLQFFIKADNRILKTEVATEKTTTDSRPPIAPSNTPDQTPITMTMLPDAAVATGSKRKFSQSSDRGSISTTRGSFGGSERDRSISPLGIMDLDHDDMEVMQHSPQRTPMGGVSSAIEMGVFTRSPTQGRHRKTSSVDKGKGGVEYVQVSEEKGAPEMKEREMMPLLRMDAGTRTDSRGSFGQGGGGVDMMNMDVHEHAD